MTRTKILFAIIGLIAGFAATFVILDRAAPAAAAPAAPRSPEATMAQWGESRIFVGRRAQIRVLPHVETETWVPAGTFDTIDAVLRVAVLGDPTEADELFQQIKSKYRGRMYRDWFDGPRVARLEETRELKAP